MDWVGREARAVCGDHETANAVVGLRPDHRYIGNVSIGDPHLGAIEHPVTAVTLGVSDHARGIRPEISLGEAEAADRVSGSHPRQPLLLLLL